MYSGYVTDGRISQLATFSWLCKLSTAHSTTQTVPGTTGHHFTTAHNTWLAQPLYTRLILQMNSYCENNPIISIVIEMTLVSISVGTCSQGDIAFEVDCCFTGKSAFFSLLPLGDQPLAEKASRHKLKVMALWSWAIHCFIPRGTNNQPSLVCTH